MARYRALVEGYLPSPYGMVRVLANEEFDFDGPKGRWMEPVGAPVAQVASLAAPPPIVTEVEGAGGNDPASAPSSSRRKPKPE